MPKVIQKLQEFPIESCEKLGLLSESGLKVAEELHILCLGHAPTLTPSALRRAILLAVMAAFTVVSNGWMMVAIHWKQRRRSSQLYTLIFHLALADILVAIFCILGEGFWSVLPRRQINTTNQAIVKS